MSATVTIDYDEFQNVLVEARRNNEQIHLTANQLFQKWKEGYDSAKKRYLKNSTEDIINIIEQKEGLIKTKQNRFKNVKAEDVKRWLKEIKEEVRHIL